MTTPADDERIATMREATRRFADARVRPLAASLDESESFPADLYRECASLGLFGITVPEALGGLGADVRTYAAVMEELSRGYASVADQCGLVELVGTLLATYGTPEQAERYLAPLVRFERRCAYALTEADAGPTSRAFGPPRSPTATAGGSPGRSCGSTTLPSPTSRWCSRGPIRRRATVA